MMSGIADRVMRRMRAQAGCGSRLVFTPKDFLDFGDRAAVDQALSRLVRHGRLRRIGRGLYDIPRVNPILKKIGAPDIGAAVDAIARRDNITVVPNGMAAANRLGLTTAVSARNDFLTDGSSRTVQVGKRQVRLIHAPRRLMAFQKRPAGDVVRALHWLGPDVIDSDTDAVVATLRRKLTPAVKRDLARARSKLDGRTARIADRVLAKA